jgi:hypothetical protein
MLLPMSRLPVLRNPRFKPYPSDLSDDELTIRHRLYLNPNPLDLCRSGFTRNSQCNFLRAENRMSDLIRKENFKEAQIITKFKF